MFRHFHRGLTKSHRDDRETRAQRAAVTSITVQYLGAFRALGDSVVVDVDDVSVASIRAAVSSSLVAIDRADLNTILTRSVFAEGDELLKDDATVSGSEVSLLPPVAGG